MRGLAAAMVLMVIGCSDGEDGGPGEDAPGCPPDANPLVGTWAGMTTIELAADGSFTISDGKHGTWQAGSVWLELLYSGDPYLVSDERPFAVQGDRLGLGVYRRTSAGTSLEGSTWLTEASSTFRAGSSAFFHSTSTIQLAADGTAEWRFVNMTAGMTFTGVTPGTWTAVGDAFRLDLAPPGTTSSSIDYVKVSEVVAESAHTYSRLCN